MNKNDKRILDLQKKIEEKEITLDKGKRPSYFTNCILHLNGDKRSFHSMSIHELQTVMMKLNSYKLSAVDLGYGETFLYEGYPLNAWMEDVAVLLIKRNLEQEEKSLKKMKAKLASLLSNDTRIELELDTIENELS